MIDENGLHSDDDDHFGAVYTIKNGVGEVMSQWREREAIGPQLSEALRHLARWLR